MFFWRKPPKDTPDSFRKDNPASPSARTILGPGWAFKGRMSGKGEVLLQSAFEGELDLQGRVVLAPGGMAKGRLRAEEIRIGGHVEGRLEGSRAVILEPSARLEGEVAAPRLEMAEGARLDGRVAMDPHRGPSAGQQEVQ